MVWCFVGEWSTSFHNDTRRGEEKNEKALSYIDPTSVKRQPISHTHKKMNTAEKQRSENASTHHGSSLNQVVCTPLLLDCGLLQGPAKGGYHCIHRTSTIVAFCCCAPLSYWIVCDHKASCTAGCTTSNNEGFRTRKNDHIAFHPTTDVRRRVIFS
jgi:hypothetical protein